MDPNEQARHDDLNPKPKKRTRKKPAKKQAETLPQVPPIPEQFLRDLEEADRLMNEFVTLDQADERALAEGLVRTVSARSTAVHALASIAASDRATNDQRIRAATTILQQTHPERATKIARKLDQLAEGAIRVPKSSTRTQTKPSPAKRT